MFVVTDRLLLMILEHSVRATDCGKKDLPLVIVGAGLKDIPIIIKVFQ